MEMSWAVQRFRSSWVAIVGMGAAKGVFVTTCKFPQEAIEFAQRLTRRVILIDGQRLAALMNEHGIGVRLSRAIEFKRLDENFFDEDD